MISKGYKRIRRLIMVSSRPLQIWLLTLCALTILMIAVGGVTRLTESGLSIVEWQPISGILPPLTQGDWDRIFSQYKQFPEFQKVRPDMTLTEFKKIFWWEYFHRFLGRFIGVVFLLPYLYFFIRKKIPQGYSIKFLIAFFLGGAQGFLGWYMVQSGLIDHSSVSHFRLAAHLLLALFLLAYLSWLFLDLKIPERRKANPRFLLFRIILRVFFFILILQIFYGALTAGLNAGFVYNTFPRMQGEWVPAAFFAMPTLSQNLFSNVASVQCLHRVFGWSLVLGVGLIFCVARRLDLSFFQARALKIFSLLLLLQFVLGVITLLSHVSILVAVTHQVTAALIVLSVVNLEFSLRRQT